MHATTAHLAGPPPPRHRARSTTAPPTSASRRPTWSDTARPRSPRAPTRCSTCPAGCPWRCSAQASWSARSRASTRQVAPCAAPSKPEQLAGKLLGASWVTAFAALFLVITGLTTVFDNPALQEVLWPAGSTLVVGLLYLAEGAVRRNTLHYGLGTWLTLVAAAALLLSTPGLFWMLTVAGGGGYIVAAVLERRRLAGAAKAPLAASSMSRRRP